jgi:prepilin-type N-terminal cleavage/methylation domain-containing protein
MKQKRPAFTLMEMLVSITIFTLFIGFAMGSMNFFYRVQREAAQERFLLMEMQGVLDHTTRLLHDHYIDYEAYAQSTSQGIFVLDSKGNKWSILVEDEKLFERGVDSSGQPLPGYTEPRLLHDPAVRIDEFQLSLFPEKDPYAPENRGQDDLQYQPIIGIDLVGSLPGRVRDVLSVDLHTSVTSRFYSPAP